MADNEKVSIDEFLDKRKHFVSDNGAVFKGVVSERSYSAETRSGRFVMSSEAPDRMNDIVRQLGIDLSNFTANPVALAYHDNRSPIGNWKDVEVVSNGRPPRTEGTMELHAPGTTAAIDEVANLLAAGGLKAVSIGFKPKDVIMIRDEDGKWNGGFDIPESDLLECSVVTIPAQPQALMKDAGGNMPLLAEALEYIADNYCEERDSGLFLRKDYTDLLKEIRGNKTTSTMITQTKIDADFQEFEKRADGIMDKFRKGFESMFGSVEKAADKLDPFAKYDGQMEHEEQEDGSCVVTKWPQYCKFARDLEMDGFEIVKTDDVISITAANQIAKYHVDGDDNSVFHQQAFKSQFYFPELICFSQYSS